MMRRIFCNIKCLVSLGPKQYVKQRIKLPLVKFIHDTVNVYKTRTQTGVDNVRSILFRGTIVALITALLVWLSIMMYMAFYYVYVPKIAHERPVHLQFKPCEVNEQCKNIKGMCSFPSAYVELTEKQQLLMMGQPYQIYLDLEMPESPTNRELDFRGKERKLLANSCRSAMLHYKSSFLDTLYKLVFIPFFIFGSAEETQTLRVELFSDYLDLGPEPVTDIFVEIQSRHIEIYSAKFSINANFSGLRYLMFNWPLFSAAIGITANLFFIALTCLMSWYQIINSEEYATFMSPDESLQLFENDEETDSSYSNETEDLMSLSSVRHRANTKDFIEELQSAAEN